MLYRFYMPNLRRSPYERHRSVMSLFPDDCDDGRVLFRSVGNVLMVQSDTRPCCDCAVYKPQFSDSTIMRFSVRANAVKRDKHTGRRVPMRDAAGWLAKKSQMIGCEVLEFSYSPGKTVVFMAKQRMVSLFVVDFVGTIRVLDTAALSAAVAQGVGPAKAFGCGLLLVEDV